MSQGVTEWRWLAEPLEEGEKELHLTLTALIGVDATEFEYAVRTFERTLTVEAVPQSTGNRISDFLDKNMQWIGPAVLIPLLAWAARAVWRRMRPSRSRTGPSGAEPAPTHERRVPAHADQARAGTSEQPDAVSESVEVPPD